MQPKQLEALAYSAFVQHYNSTKRAGWGSAKAHWDANEAARILWAQIAMGVVICARQIDASPAPKLNSLPGLGAPMPPQIDMSPRAIALRIAEARASQTGAARDIEQVRRLREASQPVAPPQIEAQALSAGEPTPDRGSFESALVAAEMTTAEHTAFLHATATGEPIDVRIVDDVNTDPFPDDPMPNRDEDKQAYDHWKTRNFGRIYGSPGLPTTLGQHLIDKAAEAGPVSRETVAKSFNEHIRAIDETWPDNGRDHPVTDK